MIEMKVQQSLEGHKFPISWLEFPANVKKTSISEDVGNSHLRLGRLLWQEKKQVKYTMYSLLNILDDGQDILIFKC